MERRKPEFWRVVELEEVEGNVVDDRRSRRAIEEGDFSREDELERFEGKRGGRRGAEMERDL